MRPFRLLAAAGLVAALAGCTQTVSAPDTGANPAAEAVASVPAQPAVQPSAEAADHIAWYDGDVAAAFETAKSQGKPMFLYWGAVWCPPCYYLKHTVFQKPEVKEQIDQFLPVYMDGDMKSAQTWGEKYDVQGYPTVILFTPQGEEFMRMPSALPADRYAEVLAQALDGMRPVTEAFATTMKAADGQADPKDIKLLAYYAWDQDSQLALEDTEKAATFQTLMAKTPANLSTEQSRFFMLYLLAAINNHDAESKDPVFAPADSPALVERFGALLADPQQVSANLSDLTYNSKELVSALYPEASPERTALVEQYRAVMTAVEADETLSHEQRIDALYPALELYRLENPAKTEEETVTIPAELQAHVKEMVSAADAAVTDKDVRQSLMSDLSWVMQEAGMPADAETMLKASLDQNVAPYYFMTDMADIAETADRKDEAITWYKKAYESTDATAEGGMTRFRWGYSYLRALLRLTPADDAAIGQETQRVLAELLAHDDAFALGNQMRLSSLATAIQEWNAEAKHDAVVSAIRDQVLAACPSFADEGEDSQRDRCEAFLKPEEKGTE